VEVQARRGEFVAVKREWKNGDRIRLELPMSLRLEAVDPQHPNLVALMRGPLVLFALADTQPDFKRTDLLQAQAANNPKGDWLVTSAQGTTVIMRPFMSIDDESYSTYVRAS
jgi:DUF1680 family protein